MTISANKRDSAVELAVLLVAALALGAPSLLYPFGFDQSNQAVSASMVLDGGVPFSEVPSLKPPLTIAFHGIAIALFGKSMMALRILDLVWTAVTALVIGACARRTRPELPGIGVLAGIAYVHTYYCFSFWHTAQTDGWMNLPVAGAMYLVLCAWDEPALPPRRQALRWAGVGALTVAALLFKYSAAGFVGVFGLAAAGCFLRGRRPGAIAVGGFAAGFFLAVLALVLVLVAWGAWDGFIHDHLPTAMRYADTSPAASGNSSFVVRLFRRLTALGPAPLLLLESPKTFWIGGAGALVVIVAAVRRDTTLRERGGLALLLAWLGAAWMSTAVQGRYFGYHFLPLLAPWAVFAGIACARAVAWARTTFSRRWMLWGSVPVIVLLLVWGNRGAFFYPYLPLGEQYALLGRVLGGDSREDTWRHGPYEVAPNFSVAETVAVIDYLRSHSTSSDSLFIWGSNQAIYFLADRPRVSLITTAYQASEQQVAAGGQHGGDHLLADLTLTPPSIVLVQHGDALPTILGHAKDSFELLDDVPRIRDYLRARYRLRAHVGRCDILVRVL